MLSRMKNKQREARRDLEARRRAAAQPLFFGCFPPGHVPTWRELADSAERLRLEGLTRESVETIMGAAARSARQELRRARRSRS